MMSQMKFNPLSTQHKEWVSLFRQSSVSTNIQSLTFVKKLTALTLSTITYNRGVFASSQYDDYTLDGRPIKLLRGNHASKRAFLFTTCIKSAFQAIEKHYMRELTLEISSTDGNIIEFYKLFYSYEGEQGCISLSQGTGRTNRIYRLEDIQEDTTKMLRSLTRFTQNLKPLPETYIIQLRITYYDEVTPHVYQPKFFSAGIPKELDNNLKKDSLGDMKTNYHTVNLESGSLLKYDTKVQDKPTPVLKKTTKKKSPKIASIQDTDDDCVITSPSTVMIEQMSFGRFTVVSRSRTELVMPSNAAKPSTSKATDSNIFSLDSSEPMPSTSKMIKQTPKRKGILSKSLKEVTQDTDITSTGITSSEENRDIYSLDESPERLTLLEVNKKGKSVVYRKSKEGVKKSNLFPPVVENIEINETKDSSVEIEDDNNEKNHSSLSGHMNIDHQNEPINILSASSPEHSIELPKNSALSENQKKQVNDTRAVSPAVSEPFGSETTQDSLQHKMNTNEEVNDARAVSPAVSEPFGSETTQDSLQHKMDTNKEVNDARAVSPAVSEPFGSETTQDSLQHKMDTNKEVNDTRAVSPAVSEPFGSETTQDSLQHKMGTNEEVNGVNQGALVINESCDDEPMQNDPLISGEQCFQVDACIKLLDSQSYRDTKSPISSPAMDMTYDPAAADEDYDTSEPEGEADMDVKPIIEVHHITDNKREQLNDSPTLNDNQNTDVLIPSQLIKKEIEDSCTSQEPTTGGYGTSGATYGKERYSLSDPMGVCSFDLNVDHINKELSQTRETQGEKKSGEQIKTQTAGDINNNGNYVSLQNQDGRDDGMNRIKRLKLDHSPVIPSQGSASYSSFIHTTKETSEEGDRNFKINCLCQKDYLAEVFECQTCNTYHHVVCYGFMPDTSAPLIGCCYQCASEANVPKLCTDPQLVQLDGDPTLLAIYRQILINLSLHCDRGKHHIPIETMVSWIGSESNFADDYIQRLNDEGFIRPSSRKHNEYTIKVKKLEAAIKEHFRTN